MIISLTVVGGFRLIVVSLRGLAEVDIEHELLNEAQIVYLEYMTKEDMSDKGEKKAANETDIVKWKVETDSVPVFDEIELTFRRLTVEYREREMVLYLPEE